MLGTVVVLTPGVIQAYSVLDGKHNNTSAVLNHHQNWTCQYIGSELSAHTVTMSSPFATKAMTACPMGAEMWSTTISTLLAQAFA